MLSAFEGNKAFSPCHVEAVPLCHMCMQALISITIISKAPKIVVMWSVPL